MLRFAVPMAVLVFASRVDAGELDTPTEFEFRSLDQHQLKNKLEEGDSLTGKALLKVRYHRESAWLFEHETDLVAEVKDPKRTKYSLAKLEKPVKLDRTKRVECHTILPTAKGKWLASVSVTKPIQLLGSKPPAFRLNCSTAGNLFVAQDSVDFKWLDVGTPTKVNFGYNISIDRAIPGAVAKAKDAARDSEIVATVELFDAETKTLVHTRTLPFGQKRGLDTFGFFTNADKGDDFEAKEGTPLLYRMTIPTKKGGAVLAEGEVTPWRLGAVAQRSTIAFDATFARYEKDPKKVPKAGEWAAAKAPAKKPAKK